MGYYSDIAVRIKPRKDNDVCISFSIIKYNFVRGIEDKLGYDEANRLWSKAIFIENADEITMYWTAINRRDAEAIIEYSGKMTEVEPENSIIAGIQYICIGEDIDDIEEFYYGDIDMYLSVTRKIDLY